MRHLAPTDLRTDRRDWGRPGICARRWTVSIEALRSPADEFRGAVASEHQDANHSL
jgi:hypothetical protein